MYSYDVNKVEDDSPSTCSHVEETPEKSDLYEDLDDGSLEQSTQALEDDSARDVPKDRFYFVYMIVLLNGIGVLLPWNMFITIAPQYYVDFWFTYNGTESKYASSFMSALGITSQIPNFLMAVVSVSAIIKGPILYKVFSSLGLNCVLISVILGLVIFQQPSPDDQHWFYIVSLIIVLVMNASNGMYQNSIFGLATDFPFSYTNSLVIGSNICGTFTSVVSIVATLAFKDPKTVALIYFSISLAVLVLCVITLIILQKLPYYQYFYTRGEQTRAMEKSTRPSLKQYWEAIKCSWVHFISIFLTFFVTLSIFPTILVGTIPKSVTGANPQTKLDQIYGGLTIFLNFNLFAFLGSSTASIIQFPPKKFLIFPVLVRLLFIPYFMLCSYDVANRGFEVIFRNQWWFIIANTVMAYSSGYFSSLGMMYAPSCAPPSLQKVTGQCAALSLTGGIMAGVAFTPLITKMVESF